MTFMKNCEVIYEKQGKAAPTAAGYATIPVSAGGKADGAA
jgi:hypothetical protein